MFIISAEQLFSRVNRELVLAERIHGKKKVREFPVPSRDVTTKLSLGGNNDVITEFFLTRGSLVSDIPAGDGKLVNLFLRCRDSQPNPGNCDVYRSAGNLSRGWQP